MRRIAKWNSAIKAAITRITIRLWVPAHGTQTQCLSTAVTGVAAVTELSQSVKKNTSIA